jgi:hypothetical protein
MKTLAKEKLSTFVRKTGDMMKIEQHLVKERKAGCCNWETGTFYTFEGQPQKTMGMCAECFLEFLIERKANVSIR